MFKSALEVIELTEKNNCRICDIVLMKECKLSEKSDIEIKNRVKDTLEVMKHSAEYGRDVAVKSVSGIISGNAKKVEEYRKKEILYAEI